MIAIGFGGRIFKPYDSQSICANQQEFRLWLSCITFSEVKHVTERLRRVKFTSLWVHSHLRHALHFVGKLVTHVDYHGVFD